MNIKSLIVLFLALSIQVFAQAPDATQPTPQPEDTSKNSEKISTEAAITEDINSVNCNNKERLESVKQLYLKMGATEDQIRIEKQGGAENLIVTKKGSKTGKIVVGAHYDKTSEGCGAIDNWTGIVITAHLFRTLNKYDTFKTYEFVAFGKEELGLIGSDGMADAIPKEERAGYCSMVNFDSFGFTYPQAMTNISSDTMIELAESTAKEIQMPFASAPIPGASSDSESFRKRKIPAITFHGMNGDWPKYLHSSRDTVKSVSMRAVYVSYRFGLNYIVKLEAAECDAFRKK